MLATLRDLKMSGGGKQNTGQSEKENKGKQDVIVHSLSFFLLCLGDRSGFGDWPNFCLKSTGLRGLRLLFWLISIFSGSSGFSVVSVLGSVGGKALVIVVLVVPVEAVISRP